jgi:hypothetical protein
VDAIAEGGGKMLFHITRGKYMIPLAEIPDELAGMVREMAEKRKTQKEIADAIGTNQTTVCQYMKKHGIVPGKFLRRERYEPILRDLVGNGMSGNKIAKHLGFGVGPIYDALKAWGIREGQGKSGLISCRSAQTAN